MITIKQSNLRCELRDELTWPRPLQPGVGHFNIVSCMASTIESNDNKKKRNLKFQMANQEFVALLGFFCFFCVISFLSVEHLEQIEIVLNLVVDVNKNLNQKKSSHISVVISKEDYLLINRQQKNKNLT